MRKLLYLSSFILTASACVTVPNARTYAVAGKLSHGGIWAETQTPLTGDLTMDEFLDFLEAQDARPDPKDPTKVLPAHGAAVCLTSDDFDKLQTALGQACRELGKRCSKEVQAEIQKLGVRP